MSRLVIGVESHVDHALPNKVWDQVEKLSGSGFQIVELKLDNPIPCGIVGPSTNTQRPDKVDMVQRVGRDGLTPMVDIPKEGMPTTLRVTVVAGPNGGSDFYLYTAYAGSVAPKEPWDVPDDLQESIKFWNEHALIKE